MSEALDVEIKKMLEKSGKGWEHAEERVVEFIKTLCAEYSEFFKIDQVDLFKAFEKKRDYSYPNYYQRANFPKLEGVTVFENEADMLSKIDAKQGFRCPSCKGISKGPYICDASNDCGWKSYGLFGTIGKGLRFTIRETFLEKPQVDEIFYPISLEKTDDKSVASS